MSPQDPVATELLEKALRENADKDSIFTTAMLNSDGEIVTQDDVEVDNIIQQRQSSKRSGGTRAAGTPAVASSSRAPPKVSRRKVGDVTRDFGGMEVSDDDGL